jgi:hypothetical protein
MLAVSLSCNSMRPEVTVWRMAEMKMNVVMFTAAAECGIFFYEANYTSSNYQSEKFRE